MSHRRLKGSSIHTSIFSNIDLFLVILIPYTLEVEGEQRNYQGRILRLWSSSDLLPFLCEALICMAHVPPIDIGISNKFQLTQFFRLYLVLRCEKLSSLES